MMQFTVVSQRARLAVLASLALCILGTIRAGAADLSAHCAPAPTACLELALAAMGGRERLEAVHAVGIEGIQHTLLVEQSYRQDPFITAYARTQWTIDFAGERLRVQEHLTWPESDSGQAESDSTQVIGLQGGVTRTGQRDTPASLANVDEARYALALGPMRVLLTALRAADLHYGTPTLLRGSRHPVIAFTWQGQPVRIMINPYTRLPDAVETDGVLHDHWYQWGDVRRRIYFEGFQLIHGIVYPTNEVEERNGILWQSRQVLGLKLNPPLDAADFKMDAQAAQKSLQSAGWERPFAAQAGVELAPGVTLFPGAWNATVVKQEDGIVLLEAPLSGTYLGGVFEKAKAQYPGTPVTAVISTSDSWPHVGGVRQAVALGLPVYILDLNKPLLERLIASTRKEHPDLLAQSPRRARWRIVSQKVQVGSGSNRMVLYPLRGASTERQYMAYFPEHQLLYASDTLALNEDGSLYDPELMHEVIEAVEREHLSETTVFAMHQEPIPWVQVTALVEKALN